MGSVVLSGKYSVSRKLTRPPPDNFGFTGNSSPWTCKVMKWIVAAFRLFFNLFTAQPLIAQQNSGFHWITRTHDSSFTIFHWIYHFIAFKKLKLNNTKSKRFNDRCLLSFQVETSEQYRIHTDWRLPRLPKCHFLGIHRVASLNTNCGRLEGVECVEIQIPFAVNAN